MRMHVSLVLLVAMVAAITHGTKFCDQKCYPGMACWPSDEEQAHFLNTLEGSHVLPMFPNYASANKVENGRVRKDPALIVYIHSENDVKKCIAYAKKHNIRVTILSSGHSYVGRSSHDGSLVINMRNMTEISVRPDLTSRSVGGEVTVQTGNNWARVYEEVDKYNRIVVGGSAHTVAMGGYTQGGGHSPMSRSLGLAVDNLLEAKLVTAEGHLVTVSEAGTFYHETGEMDGDTQLFWALRGGGGGTWGVIITFTFKMHIPPQGFVHFSSFYPMRVNGTLPGLNILENVVNEIKKLPNEWGGYVVLSSDPTGTVGADGIITLSLLHFGPWNTASRAAINTLMNDPYSVYNEANNRSTFWEYEKGVTDVSLGTMRAYVINSLVPDTVDAAQLSRVIVDGIFDGITAGVNGFGGTFTLLGGKMREVDYSATPVNPGFRDALFSVSLGRVWGYAHEDMANIEPALRFNTRLMELGNGVYFNEPAADLDNWKTDYWGKGGNYDRLLRIKKSWDADNFFCCHDCVGSDLEHMQHEYPMSGASAISVLSLLSTFIMGVFVAAL